MLITIFHFRFHKMWKCRFQLINKNSLVLSLRAFTGNNRFLVRKSQRVNCDHRNLKIPKKKKVEI